MNKTYGISQSNFVSRVGALRNINLQRLKGDDNVLSQCDLRDQTSFILTKPVNNPLNYDGRTNEFACDGGWVIVRERESLTFRDGVNLLRLCYNTLTLSSLTTSRTLSIPITKPINHCESIGSTIYPK